MNLFIAFLAGAVVGLLFHKRVNAVLAKEADEAARYIEHLEAKIKFLTRSK